MSDGWKEGRREGGKKKEEEEAWEEVPGSGVCEVVSSRPLALDPARCHGSCMYAAGFLRLSPPPNKGPVSSVCFSCHSFQLAEESDMLGQEPIKQLGRLQASCLAAIMFL